MQILVEEEGHKLVDIRLPSTLLYSRIGIKLALRLMKKNSKEADVINLSPELISRLARALKRIKKNHPNYSLVDIESDDGTIVKIIL